MHSRIFQIESSPVAKEDRICARSIPEWFELDIADYVADIKDENREKEIEWLMDTNFGAVCERNSDRIKFDICTDPFFEEDFKQFKETLAALAELDFKQFILRDSNTLQKDLNYLMYLLRETCDDRYGFYVWCGDELYTMQTWVRQVKPLDVYYFGGIVDYHF